METGNLSGTSMRAEQDSMGIIEVPADCYWGAQTQRSLHYFAIGNDHFPPEFIRAFAQVKKAAARTNQALGKLDDARADLIATTCDELLQGHLAEQFPLSVWQTGSGTQTNMNLNEVIANRANERAGQPRGSKSPVHPNDHVNLSQSTNDAFPTAMHLAALNQIQQELLPALTELRAGLAAKASAFDSIVKIGRTHLMDATPLTLGQEFSAWVAQLDSAKHNIEQAAEPLLEVAMGGSAVGTGLNTHPDYAVTVARFLAQISGHPIRATGNKFSLLAAHDGLAHLHGALKILAIVLMKIANDIRLLGSGPRAGLAELQLPANEPGSSIMPGKVNPTQCEALTMMAAQVMGNDVAIGIAASNGHLQLNAFKPVIIHNLLWSLRLLADGCRSFARHCVAGIEADTGRIAAYVERSLMLVTALTPRIGYDRAASVAKHAHARGISLKAACLELGVLDANEFDALMQPATMVKPSE